MSCGNKFALFTELQMVVRKFERQYAKTLENKQKFIYFKLTSFVAMRQILTKTYIKLSNLIRSLIDSMRIVNVNQKSQPLIPDEIKNKEIKEIKENKTKPVELKLHPKGKSGKIKALKEKKEKKESKLQTEKDKRKTSVLKAADKVILKSIQKKKSARVKTKTLYKLFQSLIQVFDAKIKPFESKTERPRNSFKKLKTSSLGILIDQQKTQTKEDIKMKNKKIYVSFKAENFAKQLTKLKHTAILIESHVKMHFKNAFIMDTYKQSFNSVKFIRDDERFTCFEI